MQGKTISRRVDGGMKTWGKRKMEENLTHFITDFRDREREGGREGERYIDVRNTD